MGLRHLGPGTAGPRASPLQAAQDSYAQLEERYRSRLNAATTDQQEDAVHDRFQPMLKEGEPS